MTWLECPEQSTAKEGATELQSSKILCRGSLESFVEYYVCTWMVNLYLGCIGSYQRVIDLNTPQLCTGLKDICTLTSPNGEKSLST